MSGRFDPVPLGYIHLQVVSPMFLLLSASAHTLSALPCHLSHLQIMCTLQADPAAATPVGAPAAAAASGEATITEPVVKVTGSEDAAGGDTVEVRLFRI